MEKRLSDRYQPGKCAMQKFKLWKSLDCVVVGSMRTNAVHVEHLLLGLYDDTGKLDYVGRCPSPGAEVQMHRKVKPVLNGEVHRPPAETHQSLDRQRHAPVMLMIDSRGNPFRVTGAGYAPGHFDFFSADGPYSFKTVAIGRTPIPDTLLLFASAMSGLGFVGWRRRKHAALAS
jgi:hypothetical protein